MQTLAPTFLLRGLAVASVAAALLTGAPPSAEANAVCQGIPTAIEGDTASESSGAIDAAAFHGARAPMEAEMDALCRTSADAARLFKARAQRVVFVMAAGATEPTPYLSGDELIVEFHGGPFDAGAFGGAVDDALHGVVPDFND
jgi:hypothetical protein